jgi:hypothetical protein
VTRVSQSRRGDAKSAAVAGGWIASLVPLILAAWAAGVLSGAPSGDDLPLHLADAHPSSLLGPVGNQTLAEAEAQFRLGDAAGSLGLSTAVADFNEDGRPDLAVADYVTAEPAGHEYRIEFDISGERSYAITFESPYRHVAIAVADVDHDDDLDLVADLPLSGAPLHVWLNDGKGHFISSNVQPGHSVARPHQALQPVGPIAHNLVAIRAPGDPQTAVQARAGAVVRIFTSAAPPIHGRSSCAATSLAPAGPRAPPDSFRTLRS